MSEKPLKKFEVDFLQVMDEKGNVDASLMPKISNDKIRQLYRLMVAARMFDDKCLAMQLQGRLGTYASVRGEEATQVGAAFALSASDWFGGCYRDSAAYFARNTPLSSLLSYWGGDERGSVFPKGVNNLPISIPVGTQMLHAVGVAWAAKIKRKKEVAVTLFGDGATSTGDFHEAMNFAGVFKIPVVFVCQNNQYAISVPLKSQTASETIAQKAIAYGFEGERVDGNDIFAVYKKVSEAVEKARSGKGPTMIECLTYRIGNHTTSDDAKRYRPASELEEWKKKDPIERLRNYMLSKKIWSKAEETKLWKTAQAEISKAVKEYESRPPAPAADIFNYTYEKMPWNLKAQLEELNESLKK